MARVRVSCPRRALTALWICVMRYLHSVAVAAALATASELFSAGAGRPSWRCRACRRRRLCSRNALRQCDRPPALLRRRRFTSRRRRRSSTGRHRCIMRRPLDARMVCVLCPASTAASIRTPEHSWVTTDTATPAFDWRKIGRLRRSSACLPLHTSRSVGDLCPRRSA